MPNCPACVTLNCLLRLKVHVVIVSILYTTANKVNNGVVSVVCFYMASNHVACDNLPQRNSIPKGDKMARHSMMLLLITSFHLFQSTLECLKKDNVRCNLLLCVSFSGVLSAPLSVSFSPSISLSLSLSLCQCLQCVHPKASLFYYQTLPNTRVRRVCGAVLLLLLLILR